MNLIPWVVSGGMVGLSVFVWGQGLAWQFGELSGYQLFPLFGLLAFTVMWAHYAVYFLQQIFKFGEDRWYLPITRYIVLFSLLMHPGLLIWMRWRDGFPPSTIFGLGGWVLVGIASWFIFMIFESHRWYRDQAWWRWITWANGVAMILIIFHALNLGSDLQIGWFRWVWYFFGVSLVVFLIKEYYDSRRGR